MELNENNRPLTEVPANEMPETSVQPVADASQARYPQRKSKEEVIERLKEIIADNCNADKQEIDLLKQTFYKLHKAEQDAAQKDFVNNGGKAETFIPKPDSLEGEFKSLMGSIKEKRKIMVQQLELLGECQTEMEYQFKRDLEQADSFIVEAYDKIGKKEIERLKYNRKKIKEAMIIADYHTKVTGTEVSQMIYNSFETGKWYSRKFIKEEISRIFKLFGIVPKKAVTSHTILDFFHAVESKRKNIKGYQLTMRKGI